jgi:type II secretory pathway pseudopilin PulG
VIRRITVVLVAGLLLGACGSVSASTAMVSWVSQSNFTKNAKALLSDAQHSATVLRNASSTNADLHTVCGVALYEVESANASLPTPDAQATALLSRAYTDLGAGANQCYRAQRSATARARSLASLAKGAAALSEASARIAVASLP